jgi:hypothetical protein
MKFDTHTLNVLKNFSTINPSILITKGEVLRTISPTKSIFAKAKMKQSFDSQIAIYDLSNFLSALSMFNDPTLKIESDKFATIASDNNGRGINYYFADPKTIITPPEGDIKITDYEVRFTLPNKSIIDVIKAIGILNLPEIAIVGDGNNITIQAVDSKKNGSNYYDVVGDTDKVFTAYFKAENIKILPADYDVTISKKFALFASADIDYYIAVDQNSKF